jgi:uncharacterized protein (TIGR02453 family)
MPAFPGFPESSLKFLKQLRRHNNREWFASNKSTYEQSVKTPLQELVSALAIELHPFAPDVTVDPAKSIYRIYRDVRFSPDKSPYKTHVAAIFPVRGLPKNSGPGLYFHFSADEVLVAGGVYAPGTSELRSIREYIAGHHSKLTGVLQDRRFRKVFAGLEGEQLKKLPKGFLPGHPAEPYLRYKQFLFGKQFAPELALSKKLISEILTVYKAGMPLIRFLAEPLRKLHASEFASDKLRLNN